MRITTLALSLAITVAGMAQKPKVVSGDASAISKIKTWTVSIEYNDAEIHKKDAKNDAFVAARVAEMNEKESEVGDEWKGDWEKAFERKFVNKFSLLMNKYLEKSKVKVDKDMENAGGQIVVKTYWIYLGYANPMRVQASKVSSKIHFLDASGKELLVVDMVESPGNAAFVQSSYSFGFNPDAEFTRMTESYAKQGKDLAGWLSKTAYKKK